MGSSAQVDFFSFFLIRIKKQDGFNASDIKKCFDLLDLPPYSNIPRYLKVNMKKARSRIAKFFLKRYRYYLTPVFLSEMSEKLSNTGKTIVKPTNNLYPLELFESGRPYIQKIAEQASSCYDYGLFDACNVMIRRLLETLIIETYERKSRISEIKGGDGNFYHLKDLISILTKDTNITISRNSKQGMAKLKDLGDLSAHNRRFLARKSDVDSKKDSFRIVAEELLHIIDYETWNS